jgi:hypothetical protein
VHGSRCDGAVHVVQLKLFGVDIVEFADHVAGISGSWEILSSLFEATHDVSPATGENDGARRIAGAAAMCRRSVADDDAAVRPDQVEESGGTFVVADAMHCDRRQ